MSKMMDQDLSELAELLVSRLERLPVDSHWSHQASGLRGSLLRQLEKERCGEQVNQRYLSIIIDQGFFILEKAAQSLR